MKKANPGLRIMRKSEKIAIFTSLSRRVTRCKLCTRMNRSARVLSFSSGSLDAKMMFIGEAPGRLGADSTGIPFHGDKSGKNFESLLDLSGISREDIFITNAVLCNPKDSKGNNATPNSSEINNCSGYLKQQIDLIDSPIIVTLGLNALKALSLIERHNLNLKESVRKSHRWYRRLLIPLYHPGQRAMLHRSMANQRSDYQYLAEQAMRVGIKKRAIRGKTGDLLTNLVETVLSLNGSTSYFALHKLIYLLEFNFVKEYGDRLTGAYFIRQKDGPYCTDLHIAKLKNAIEDLIIKKDKDGLILELPSRDMLLPPKDTFMRQQGTLFSDIDVNFFIAQKIREFGGKSNKELKTRVYLTGPMRKILKIEKDKNINMYNTSIRFD